MRLRSALALGVAAAALAAPAAAATPPTAHAASPQHADTRPADHAGPPRADRRRMEYAGPVRAGLRLAEYAGSPRADRRSADHAAPFRAGRPFQDAAHVARPRADDESAEYAEPLRVAPDLRLTCGDADSPEFPITTRLRGGPDTYRAGGAAGEWSLELTNTTRGTCRNIHPVVVLMDGDRELASEQVELRFRDSSGRWIDVPFETTDEDEHIGVFDGGFPGFTIAADRTVTVKVRLAFDAGAAPARALLNAAVVQRQPADGEWVGASNDYRFTVASRDPDREAEAETEPEPDPGRSRAPGRVPDASPEPDATPGPGTGDDGTPLVREHPHSLAMTGRGPGPLLALGATAGALLLAGVALMTAARRRYGSPALVRGPLRRPRWTSHPGPDRRPHRGRTGRRTRPRT
ncbi:hypothetical protein [Streptomyces sp. NPDC054887]